MALEEEEFSQNFENSMDDEHQQQQQRQQAHHQHQEENDHHRQDHHRQQEIRDNFTFIELRTENSSEFRNFAILGKKATFAICHPKVLISFVG